MLSSRKEHFYLLLLSLLLDVYIFHMMYRSSWSSYFQTSFSPYLFSMSSATSLHKERSSQLILCLLFLILWSLLFLKLYLTNIRFLSNSLNLIESLRFFIQCSQRRQLTGCFAPSRLKYVCCKNQESCQGFLPLLRRH